MLDLSQFSNVMSQYSTGPSVDHVFGPPKTNADFGAPKTIKLPRVVDTASFSPVKSNQAGSSFDRIEPSSVAVNSDGTYRPTHVQQLSASLNFSFSASLSRATVVHRPNALGEVSHQREDLQVAYRSVATSEQRLNGGTYRELQRFQTDMFFSRTRTLSQRLSPERGAQLESTGREVARQFELEISLDASFLSQFSTQTEGLADDDALLEQYLDDTGGLAKHSGEALQAFFNEVDQILADTESFVKDSLGSFLTDVKAAFGLNGAEADAFTDMVIDEVTAFFNDIDAFLGEARQGMLNPPEPEPVLAQENEVGEGEEVVEEAVV